MDRLPRTPSSEFAQLLNVAFAIPWLLASNAPPSATYFNQVAAVLAWSVWILYITGAAVNEGASAELRVRRSRMVWCSALVLCVLAPLASWLPWSFALSSSCFIAAGIIVATAACSAGPLTAHKAAFVAGCLGLVIAGCGSTVVGLIQVFVPSLPDGNWIALTSVEGRAVGNLRQPNHLCTLFLWGVVAVTWLGEDRPSRRIGCLWLAAMMLFGIVLTGSRSGILGVLILALWGLLDKRLSCPSRTSLMCSPMAYVVFWAAMSLWSQHGKRTIGATGRFTTTGDISSSRFAIWSNTLDLIRAHPGTGVGFGEFNFAWTLTEFPSRPTAFFDHTHNLPLQFAVELGLPLAALVLGLLGWGLWRAWCNCLRPTEPDGAPSPQRAAFVMLVLILVHSMLEYPLWYAYFLLPSAFLFGLCLATPSVAGSAQASARRNWGIHHLLRAGAIAMMLGALYSVYDYMRVVVIFAPPENAAPLEERIAIGQRSVFFSHHADYAAATTSNDPAIALAAARRAAHYLLDTRLMMAWANALHTTGDTERAKYLAQRLAEFRNPMSEPYFVPCKDPSLSDAQRPYQCFAPQRKFTFEDFR